MLKNHDALHAALAENPELLACVVQEIEDAYEEGWYNGRNTTSVVGFHVDWVESDAQKTVNAINAASTAATD